MLLVAALRLCLSCPSLSGEETALPPLPAQLPAPTSATNHILYLAHTGNTSQSLQAYCQHSEALGAHDFDLIERIGLTILDQGFRSSDEETQLLTVFGAGISMNEKALYILEDSVTDDKPEIQLAALNFLGRIHNDRADVAINRAMTSNHLLVRLEAAFLLASKKAPRATAYTEALMAKVDERLWSIFPQIYALCGDAQSMKMMRKLLTHADEKVRIEAVLNAAKCGRDDLLPAIRRLASHHEPAQQEICAAALGLLNDSHSIPKLEALARSPNANVRLAALGALYRLGNKEARLGVEALAKENNLYAVALLGTMPGSEALLAEQAKSKNIQLRINACMALLELGDARCLPGLREVLITDARDLTILETPSPGKSLSIWKVISSSRQNFEDTPVAFELTLAAREEALTKALELPEKDFITLAHAIFERQQTDLVPTLVDALENHPTPAVIALLKKHQQKAGAPLVRNYCNLALYRLKQPGPYAENLRSWVTQQQNVDLIRFRPYVPWDLREKNTEAFEMTPHETSKLLVEAFESFVATQDDKGIDMLISVIQNGNSKNKYALIGLLMRAIQ